jgi:hypothetical protein
VTCYIVRNVVNAHSACVMRAVHALILNYYVTLRNVCYTTDAVDHVYKFELILSFQLWGVSLPNVQPTVLFKIQFSCSITVAVKERCR